MTDMCCLGFGNAFNEDISAWDTSGVTTMDTMLAGASAFNQDISGWVVDSVTNMNRMLSCASAFDQDLGWCVGDGVYLGNAFTGTVCAISSCGIADFICQP